MHFPKAEVPMYATVDGIVIFVKLLQDLKALLPIDVTFGGIVISVKLLHPKKS